MRSTVVVESQAAYDAWLEQVGRPAAGGGGGGGGADAGKAAFTSNGCGGCHELSDAGTSGGTGPNLDETLADKDEAYIREAIVNPDAEIAPGFQAGVMPPTYQDTLGDQLDPLVQYLSEVTRGG
jgi:cytochrome c oxidase subunit 2